MKEVQWTETARKTLQETSDFILELWNSNVNEEFIEQLEYRITQLQNNPELGSPFENTQIRKLVIHKSVSMFYINHNTYHIVLYNEVLIVLSGVNIQPLISSTKNIKWSDKR